MGILRSWRPIAIILGIVLLFILLELFGPWDLRIPFPFIRAFLIALGGVLTLLALSLLFSWLADAKHRRAAAELVTPEPYQPAMAGGNYVVEETYVVEPQQVAETTYVVEDAYPVVEDTYRVTEYDER